MRFIIYTLCLLVLPFTAQANITIDKLPAGNYAMDETHASLIWKVNHMGLADYAARFTKFDTKLYLDTQDITKSRVKATIDPRSVQTAYPYPEEKDFDKKLSDGKEWLNAGEFPTITFTSTKIEKTGDNTGKMTGDLTFLGVTKPVTLDVTLTGTLGNHPFKNKPAVGFSATGSIKRSDFGMTTYIPNIGDEVKIMIDAEFIHAD